MYRPAWGMGIVLLMGVFVNLADAATTFYAASASKYQPMDKDANAESITVGAFLAENKLPATASIYGAYGEDLLILGSEKALEDDGRLHSLQLPSQEAYDVEEHRVYFLFVYI